MRLAQLSILFSVASLLATIRSLTLLPFAQPAGEWILALTGGAVSILTFVFGVMTSVGARRSRQAGFVAVAATCAGAALFGLLAYVVPASTFSFLATSVAFIAYAAYATHRLVRWPGAGFWEQPKSDLAIFISYRRQDSHETVGRIQDHLKRRFRDDRIFLDVEDQQPGVDYRAAIGKALEQSQVALVVIGPQWLTITGRSGGRRLDDPADMVRIEIESALARGLRIIPVLVENASMPAAAEVPASLQPLCYRNAVPVRPDPDFEPDLERLVTGLVGGGHETATK